MKFTEFVNQKVNVLQTGAAKRISDSLEISEERDAFFNGKLFQKYDMVVSEGVQYRVLEQRSNYYVVVNESGETARKFANQLAKADNKELLYTESQFHGYTIESAAAKQIFESIDLHSNIIDDVGILKQLKEADKMDAQYKSKDKLTIAKIIADVVGVKHDAVSTPENLVASAIRQAKKDPALMKNKAMLQNMIQIAKEAGINVSDKTFAVEESVELEELSVNTLKSYSDGAKKNAVKLSAAGAKAKTIETAHAKFAKAGDRLNRAAKADKKVFKKEWESKVGITKEDVEPLTLKGLRNKLLEGSPENAKEHPQMDDKPTPEVPTSSLPHGHSLHPNSETHRRQLIKKARGD